jgi:hypothetical protein
VHIETPEAFSKWMDEQQAQLKESGDSVWQ